MSFSNDLEQKVAFLLHNTYAESNMSKADFQKMITTMRSFVSDIYIPHLKSAFENYYKDQKIDFIHRKANCDILDENSQPLLEAFSTEYTGGFNYSPAWVCFLSLFRMNWVRI